MTRVPAARVKSIKNAIIRNTGEMFTVSLPKGCCPKYGLTEFLLVFSTGGLIILGLFC